MQEDFERSRIELTGAAWILDTSGTLQARGTAIDLRKDLGVEQHTPTGIGRLVIKPGLRHRIIIEGTPHRLSGRNTLSREVVHNGTAYPIEDEVASTAELNYVFGGHQYDLVRRSQGHFGLVGGAAHLGATGTITSLRFGVSASKSERLALPLAGAEFRAFPIPGTQRVSVSGELAGMSLGQYGLSRDRSDL